MIVIFYDADRRRPSFYGYRWRLTVIVLNVTVIVKGNTCSSSPSSVQQKLVCFTDAYSLFTHMASLGAANFTRCRITPYEFKNQGIWAIH